jgi:hypothetical protein
MSASRTSVSWSPPRNGRACEFGAINTPDRNSSSRIHCLREGDEQVRSEEASRLLRFTENCPSEDSIATRADQLELCVRYLRACAFADQLELRLDCRIAVRAPTHRPYWKAHYIAFRFNLFAVTPIRGATTN